MSDDLDSEIRAVLPGGRRCGKSLAAAKLVARMIREGHTVTVCHVGEDGRTIAEKVVGVPGFNDGRQIEKRP